jgi:hypothetical protein
VTKRLAILDIITAALVKIRIFCDMLPCRLVYRYLHYGEAGCLHLRESPRIGDQVQQFGSPEYFISQDFIQLERYVPYIGKGCEMWCRRKYTTLETEASKEKGKTEQLDGTKLL